MVGAGLREAVLAGASLTEFKSSGACRPLPLCVLLRERDRRDDLLAVRRPLQAYEVGKLEDELVEHFCDADEVEGAPREGERGGVALSQRLEVRAVVTRHSHRHACLAVGRIVPEAERHAVVAEVVVPRQVLQQRVAQHRDEVAAAPGGAQRVADEE